LSPVDWIVDQQGSAAPRPDPRRVATVVRVAEAGTSREPGGQAICAAVQAGVLPVRSAAQIAPFDRDVKPLADRPCSSRTSRSCARRLPTAPTGAACLTASWRRRCGTRPT
jgi:hypothetical protein